MAEREQETTRACAACEGQKASPHGKLMPGGERSGTGAAGARDARQVRGRNELCIRTRPARYPRRNARG